MLFRFSALWGLMAAIALLCSCADTRTPNIVVIFIDDMGYADIGPFGAERSTSPTSFGRWPDVREALEASRSSTNNPR